MGNHGRRLRSLRQQKHGKTMSVWMAAAYEIDRERRAALALVKVAQALAGKLPPPAPAPFAGDAMTAVVPDAPVSLPRARSPRWTRSIRPGPHDVLTWDEAMRVPWLDGLSEAER